MPSDKICLPGKGEPARDLDESASAKRKASSRKPIGTQAKEPPVNTVKAQQQKVSKNVKSAAQPQPILKDHSSEKG